LHPVRSGQLQNLSGPVRSKSGRIIFDVNPAKIRQKSGKKSGKKIEKNPVSSGRMNFSSGLVRSGRTGAGPVPTLTCSLIDSG
jgi:hypothetical protein